MKAEWTIRTIAGLALGWCFSEAYITPNKIPKAKTVQAGYVIPSKLEIGLQDLDRNGQKETIMRYNGTNYLLRVDEKGTPLIQAYEIKPAEILPKD